MEGKRVLEQVAAVAEEFASQRRERQGRTELDPRDFARLAEAGFLTIAVPTERGGLWEGMPKTVRLASELIRTISRGDANVGLVTSMHPAVTSLWMATDPETIPEAFRQAWIDQVTEVSKVSENGGWWGTCNSEPGSGGDPLRTKATAVPVGDGNDWRLTGNKHFATGAGITARTITLAVPEGETRPDIFSMGIKDMPWDGSQGLTMTRAWDGHGMAASQSHALRFEGFPAQRFACPSFSEGASDIWGFAQPYIRCVMSAIAVGILDAAMEAARENLARRDTLRAFEEVEWAHISHKYWLVKQAFEGGLRAVETEVDVQMATHHSKLAVCDLAEEALTRTCRILGGGTFSRHSPFGFWQQDVRAVGFLRPPWALAFERVGKASLEHLS